MKYSPENVRDMLGKSTETIRKWSIEFEKFLTPGARSIQAGQHRFYEEDDLRVFFYVKQNRDLGIPFDSIWAALDQGDRAVLPSGVVLASNPNNRMQILETTVIELQNTLAQERGEKIAIERQLAEAKAEIKALNREIGRLEAGNEK